jgi:hypothetical protein
MLSQKGQPLHCLLCHALVIPKRRLGSSLFQVGDLALFFGQSKLFLNAQDPSE